MANNVKYEYELYEPMRKWLQTYLEDKYKTSKIITVDSHSRDLYLYLEEYGIVDKYPQTVGLDIQIDVLGIICRGKTTSLAFIEAKKTQLNLHDLGQLWAYCKLCNPAEAFLLSSVGLGSLNKILNNLSRTDLLDFGDGKKIKKCKLGNGISTLIPSILRHSYLKYKKGTLIIINDNQGAMCLEKRRFSFCQDSSRYQADLIPNHYRSDDIHSPSDGIRYYCGTGFPEVDQGVRGCRDGIQVPIC